MYQSMPKVSICLLSTFCPKALKVEIDGTILFQYINNITDVCHLQFLAALSALIIIFLLSIMP